MNLISYSLDLTCRTRLTRAATLVLIYAAAVLLCLWTAYQIRFDFQVPPRFVAILGGVTLLAIGAKLAALFAFCQFQGGLTFFAMPDLRRLITACSVGSLPLAILSIVRSIPPRGVVPVDFVLCIIALSVIRLCFGRARVLAFPHKIGGTPRRVGIVGAGDAGALLARQLLDDRRLGLEPVAFFDDDHEHRVSLHGIPVVGKPNEIAAFKRKLALDQIIIAMPSVPAKRIHEILTLVQEAQLECKTVPSLGQLASGHLSISALRPVRIEDLLRRAQIQRKPEAVSNILSGRTVLVTGAGGSIGSELCRQILSFNPSTLVLIERSEPNLFAIEQELLKSANGTRIIPLVADITCGMRMSSIFRSFQPQAVFHAAAHKHVPMMESQPAEAIRNNVLGTALIADMSIEHQVERFVQVSTDKAVYPTSTMGATKRCAEIYIQSLIGRSQTTKFSAVRFGNVLGSSGSVVPTFVRQIASGGPLTVTHPEMRRFFMSIPEAVTLVLEAATLGDSGDIFMLDMGQPIKILELAEQMITLSGLRPYVDIDIQFSGLRPGEKLEEVLSYSRERVEPTAHPQIQRLVSGIHDHDKVRAFIHSLRIAVEDLYLSANELKALLTRIVPEYTPFVAQSMEIDAAIPLTTTSLVLQA